MYERGFGYAEIDPVGEMQPQAEMRIASISKPITGVAVLQLVEAGRLSLDAKVVDLLKHPEGPAYPAPVDVRWNQITVRDLLHHSAAGIVDVSKDPMFQLLRLLRRSDCVIPQMPLTSFDSSLSNHSISNLGLGPLIQTLAIQFWDASSKKSPVRNMTNTYEMRFLIPPAWYKRGLARRDFRTVARLRCVTLYRSHRDTRHSGNPSLELRGKLCPRLWMHPTVSGISKSWMLMAAGSPLQVTSSLSGSPGTDRQTTAESRKPTVAAGSTTVRRRCRQRLVWLRFQRTNNGRRRCQLLAQRRTSRNLNVARPPIRWILWAILFNTDETSTEKRCSDIIDPLLHQAINASTR